MNLKENIKRILKEETSLQSKLQSMIDTKGIDIASTAVGGMKNVAKILNLDLNDVDTQSMLVKNVIEKSRNSQKCGMYKEVYYNSSYELAFLFSIENEICMV